MFIDFNSLNKQCEEILKSMGDDVYVKAKFLHSCKRDVIPDSVKIFDRDPDTGLTVIYYDYIDKIGEVRTRKATLVIKQGVTHGIKPRSTL